MIRSPTRVAFISFVALLCVHCTTLEQSAGPAAAKARRSASLPPVAYQIWLSMSRANQRRSFSLGATSLSQPVRSNFSFFTPRGHSRSTRNRPRARDPGAS